MLPGIKLIRKQKLLWNNNWFSKINITKSGWKQGGMGKQKIALVLVTEVNTINNNDITNMFDGI